MFPLDAVLISNRLQGLDGMACSPPTDRVRYRVVPTAADFDPD